MSSFTYPRPGNKSTVYVGGLPEQVDEETLRAALLPFGEILDVMIPRDNTAEAKHRGYGFVEFEDPQDALAAIDNVHLGEYWGHVLKCNLARPTRIFTAGVHSQPVWADDGNEGEEGESSAAVPSAKDEDNRME